MNNSKTGSECQTVDVYFDVYVIWCRITDMHYIGVTGQKVATRIRQHKRGKQFVDKEIQRLGWEGNFDWWSVERNVPSDIITEREQYWIDFFHAVHPYGYNKTIGGIKHFKHSEETIERMRQAQLGRHHTEDTLAKMRNKRFSDETRAKISSSQRGKPMTEKAKAILREKALERDISGKNNPFFGKHHTEEAKGKNRQAHLGRTPWIDKLPTAKAGGLCYLQPMQF